MAKAAFAAANVPSATPRRLPNRAAGWPKASIVKFSAVACRAKSRRAA